MAPSALSLLLNPIASTSPSLSHLSLVFASCTFLHSARDLSLSPRTPPSFPSPSPSLAPIPTSLFLPSPLSPSPFLYSPLALRFQASLFQLPCIEASILQPIFAKACLSQLPCVEACLSKTRSSETAVLQLASFKTCFFQLLCFETYVRPQQKDHLAVALPSEFLAW